MKLKEDVYKRAIFHKDDKQISSWYDEIQFQGLMNSQSNYYIVENNDKEAIFDKDGKQVTDWFDGIESKGLVEGQSPYYIVRDDGFYWINKLGSTRVLGPFKEIVDYGFIVDPSKSIIEVETPENRTTKIIKEELESFFEEEDHEQTK